MNKFILYIGKWYEYRFNCNNNLLTNDHIQEALNKFKEDIVYSIESHYAVPVLIHIQFKVLMSGDHNNIFRSISYVQKVTIEEVDDLFDTFCFFWSLKADEYNITPVSAIIFTYKVVDNPKGKRTRLYRPSSRLSSKFTSIFGNIKLPNTMDCTKWFGNNSLLESDMGSNTRGIATITNVNFNKNFTKAIILDPVIKNITYHISLFKDYQLVEVRSKGKIIVSFKDIINDISNLSTFTRVIRNQELIYENGNITLKKIIRDTSFMVSTSTFSTVVSSVSQTSLEGPTRKFITLDLETKKLSNGDLSPYCVSIYDGTASSHVTSFYITDYNNSDDMLKSAILSILKAKYNGYRIYVHNFSYFDGIFLLKILTSLLGHQIVTIKPIISKNNQLIDLAVKFSGSLDIKVDGGPGIKTYTVYFRDSYLMLPSSLRRLSESWLPKEEAKNIFPYSFVDTTPADYIGEVPSYKYFGDNSGITMKEYLTYCNKYSGDNHLWDLKKETIKYCEQDVKALFKVIFKFAEQIFNLFHLNIHKYPTLPSLAMAIFKSNFYNYDKKDVKTQIPLISGHIYNDIKTGYTGGNVDVYKPHSGGAGGKVYCYDVNSLYPSVMRNNLFPTGNPIYFEGPGDINKYSGGPNKPFGIFYVEVETPLDVNIPMLQVHLNNRTISPLGKWNGWYFSEEIYHAMNYGYKFNIVKGYLFEKHNIFKDYVDFLYNLKVNSTKSSPNYTISKLLLNSLYGKFGMNPEMLEHIILDNEESSLFCENHDVQNIINFDNKELISYVKNTIDNPNNNNSSLRGSKNKLNISLPIALAVTAYARIYMSQLKQDLAKKGYIVYYSDTDSIFIDKPLDDVGPQLVGTGLGKLKLEYIAEEAVFLCPKVYGVLIKTSSEVPSSSNKNGAGGSIKGLLEYVKVKGVKNPITFKELKSLLVKDSKLEISQEKWYRNIKEGNINIKDEIYTLMLTENKRKSIFSEDNLFIDTKPFIIDLDEESLK